MRRSVRVLLGELRRGGKGERGEKGASRGSRKREFGAVDRLQRSRRHRPNFTMPSLNVWMLDAKLSLGLHSVLCAFLYVYAPRLDDRRFALTASKCFEYLSF